MNRELIITVALMIALFVFEGMFPFFKTHKKHLQHTGVNVFFGIVNGLIAKLLFAALLIATFQWSKQQGIGWLNIISVSWYLEGIIAFLLFDLWMYWWHRFNHELKFLWCFHSMHHTDLEMDASTALRFHPGEKILSTLLRLFIIPVLGLELIYFIIYNIVMSPIILFHHSNIALPEKIDKFLRVIIVTPNMHRVHHSKLRKETDSNYSSVFSFWDRIFGTYKQVENTESIVYGLETMRDSWWQSIPGMLLTPVFVGGFWKNKKESIL